MQLQLSNAEKTDLQNFPDFLSPFKQATDMLQGQHYPSISLILPTVEEWIQACKVQREDDNQIDMDHNASHYYVLDVGYMGLPMSAGQPNEGFGLSDLKRKVMDALDRRFPHNDIFKLASSLDYRLKGDPCVYNTLAELCGIKAFTTLIEKPSEQIKASGSSTATLPEKNSQEEDQSPNQNPAT